MWYKERPQIVKSTLRQKVDQHTFQLPSVRFLVFTVIFSGNLGVQYIQNLVMEVNIEIGERQWQQLQITVLESRYI